MPKIIDHEAERARIAAMAVPLFREKGYDGLSFRELARELGISKSGLYHYFTGKEELFSFCGRFLLEEIGREISLGNYRDKTDLLVGLAKRLLPQFEGEMRLLLDYVNRFPDQRELPDFFNELRKLLVPVTGERDFPHLLRLLLGDLTEKLLSGNKSDWSDLEEGVGRIVQDRD